MLHPHRASGMPGLAVEDHTFAMVTDLKEMHRQGGPSTSSSCVLHVRGVAVGGCLLFPRRAPPLSPGHRRT